LDHTHNSHRAWIDSLLTQLDLVKEEAVNVSPNVYWSQLEKSRLSERIGRIVADVNGAAGYHVLEMLDFLPPQRTVLRVSFRKHWHRHHMELVLRGSGFILVFTTSRRVPSGLDRYLPSFTSKGNTTVVWQRVIQPNETLDTDIQAWLSYLLSGLDRAFKPDVVRQGSAAPEVQINSAFRKASA
jgi:hypothetical protein